MGPGELELYRAVMVQTIQDIGAMTLEERRRRGWLRHAALEWMADETDYPFSFRDCCRVLHLPYRTARKTLYRLAHRSPRRARVIPPTRHGFDAANQ